MRHLQKLLTVSLSVLVFFSCVSVAEKTGQVLDGSAFAEKQTAVYRTARNADAAMEIREIRNKAGEYSIVITLQQFPAMKIQGTAPDNNGEFHLLALDYRGGNVHGWNEYRLDLAGSGNLVLGETTAKLSVSDEIHTIGISSGRIRRYDTRITGTDALSSLRNRHDRILALAKWMNSRENPPTFNNGDAFEKYWKPILFPEMVSKKKRPADWRQENDQWVRAESIRWNTRYTERVFPEVLWAIRNSGTMLRDWEEAVEWIYIEYEWSRIQELLAQDTILDRRK
jgi:hypothetical protein